MGEINKFTLTYLYTIVYEIASIHEVLQ